MLLVQAQDRRTAALALLQPTIQTGAAKTGTSGSDRDITATDAVSLIPSNALKQAVSAAALTAINKASDPDEDQATPKGKLIIAGIRGPDSVDYFDSWEDFEIKIKGELGLDQSKRTYWLDQSKSLQKLFAPFTNEINTDLDITYKFKKF